ncbi:MAG TPA: CoA-acylating methylmalonate-semialdehyde dehydrogenase, partial [Candidatus Acidoferrales bacterium]|nr:CoA-acylating methylmalonate-semialdehyde dehydrogenase [Candidatus Acidoferrales bacterium]
MIPNLVGSRWERPDVDTLPVFNPATGEVIEQVPLSGAAEVEAAVKAAAAAFETWARTPLMERVRLMFRFKAELEEHVEELAAIVTRHHGKTLDEARGEVRRGIEVVDFACGAPTLLQGRTLREVSSGVDQDLYRYPVGVCAGVPPFNFPVMIPLWMFPLAVVAGNTFVLKPSERTPLGALRLAELFLQAGFPEGVLNLVHGAQAAVEALLIHPVVRAVSFVGSAPVARHVYETAAAHGKRVQALGGAKNHILVMPDADLESAVPAILNSAFGNAGERCLAGSVAVAVGAASKAMLEPLTDAAAKLVVGPGDQPGVQVGPLIRAEHRQKVLAYVERGEAEGAAVLVDGRRELERPGFFFGPTVLDRVSPEMAVGRDEIFGPVLSVSHVSSLDQAIAQANQMALGNMAVIFTQSGRAAREFRERVEAGMCGI